MSDEAAQQPRRGDLETGPLPPGPRWQDPIESGINKHGTNDSLEDIEDPKLTPFDVGSFMINRMIGVGIFTNPPLVLWFCGNQHLALWVWFAGGLFSLMCFCVYVEYGAAWHYNGGELLYLDRIFRSKRIKRLRYLPPLAFSFSMILIGTAYPNAFGFAKHILISFNPHIKDPYQLDQHAVKGVAVAVVTAVTLILYRNKWLAIRMNRLFAVYKVGLLFGLSIVGYAHRHEGVTWSQPFNGSKFISGFFVVMFSYQGWEIPFYVLGELAEDRSCKKMLRIGGISAIVAVTMLYMMVNVAVMVVLPFETLVGGEGLAAITEKPWATSTAAFLVSLSPVGNIIASTYVYARVCQIIGEQKLVPFWKILQRRSKFEPKTSSGGYLVHWITCTAAIVAVATPHYKASSSSIGMPVYVYARALIVAIIAGALLYTVKIDTRIWMWRFLTGVVVLVNIAVMVITMIPSQQDKDAPLRMWLQPVVGLGTMGLGILWGVLLWPLEKPPPPVSGDNGVRANTASPDDTMRTANVTPRSEVTQITEVKVQDFVVPEPLLKSEEYNMLQKLLGFALVIEHEPPEGWPSEENNQGRGNRPLAEQKDDQAKTKDKHMGQPRVVTYVKVRNGGLLGFLRGLTPPEWVRKYLWPNKERLAA